MAKKPFIGVNSLTMLDRKKLKNAIMEINDSMTRVAAEADLQKDVLNNISDDLGLDTKFVKRLARTYYKSSFNVEVEENKKFEEFYSTLLTAHQEQGNEYAD